MIPKECKRLAEVDFPHCFGGDPRFQEVSRFLSEMRVYRIDPAPLRTMQDPDGGVRLHSDGSNTAFYEIVKIQKLG